MRTITAAICLVLAGALLLADRALAELPAPPPTPRQDVSESYHGTQVQDPYRWLEQADAPAVTQWIDAQNAYTDKVMTGFRDAGAIARRIGTLALTSTQRSQPKLVGGVLFYLRQTPPQPQPVLVAERWPGGEPKVLVDTNAANGDIAITDYWPAPDGRRVAYGTAKGGDENTTIRFVDVADGKVAADELPFAGGGTTPEALAWDGDGKGVIYARLPLPGSVPPAQSQFGAVLYHHVFGTPAGVDVAALGQGFSPIAEYLLYSSPHGTRTAALVHFGDGAPESVYLRTRGSWKKALGPQANINAAASTTGGAAWDGERLLLISSQDAPRGKLLALDAAGQSRVLVPQGDWAMDGVAPVQGGFLLTEVHGPDWRVRQFDAEGKPVRTLPLPPTGIAVRDVAGAADSPSALVGYQGWSVPARWVRFDARSGALETVFEVKPAADYSAVRSYRLEATSADGTRVPVTLLALAGVTPNGKRPAILTAYGGYGLSQTPRFIGTTLAWLERGGVWALANIRGGGEFGDGWHQSGRLANKQHCFDDLHAAAQALLGAHWTDRAHLGIVGGSNGGLLMGASLTQHPADYRAVVSFVGIYDMLRWELWPNGRYNTSEYGTVTQAADFTWLYAYSPLHHVTAGAPYPAVLLVTAENDPRVAPWQSRKFAAALQAANTSQRPVLLITRRNEGHGVTSSFSQRVGNTGVMLSFLAEQLDLPSAPGAGNGGKASQ
jgi:prolyl oligopeptidase